MRGFRKFAEGVPDFRWGSRGAGCRAQGSGFRGFGGLGGSCVVIKVPLRVPVKGSSIGIL